ncbi:hypothetical protein CspeluHIS016_0404350 [Cutaneotrichosporon spelunceum]|uniref:Ubiquitin-like protease family profile domain-containing protein n=1 Tax=Cutaneotrichosporon spelunceum TaxID=1672016 RepID=A0AAD3TW08_9TREE|nr:hypothetical protein CspeluHIS016_0404350 [Cutaneotrichosporon spelunceum]
MFTNENISRQINLQSIAAVFHCNDDNFVLDLSLDNEELLQLSSFLDEPLSNSTTEATATRYTDIRALLVVNDSKLARLFIKEMSVAPGMQGKTEDVHLFRLHGLDITAGERYRLVSNDFLNDTFLEFGLRYVLDQLPLETRDEVHCFNSFFYAKLSEKSSRKSARYGGSWPGYDAVKRWTRKVDIFSKKFIIVPVNESYHWYLAVIFNPRGAVDMARASRPLVADALRDRHDSQRPSPPSEGVALDDNLEDVIRNESPPSAAGVQDGRRAAPSDNEYSPDTDPLNIIDQPDDEPAGKEERGVVAVRAGVNRLQIEAAAPQPIRSDTFDLFTEQSLGDMGTGAKTEEPTSQAPSPLPARKGKKPHREDYNLLGTDETWIFTLDSMGSRHPSVGANLRKWLSFEARDKLNEEVDFEPVRYFEGKCLEQHNFYDCGLYLIHFAKQLLLKSDEVLHFIGGAPRTAGVEGHAEWTQKKNEVWAADALSTLREDWVHIIDFQTQTYRSLHGSVATGQVVQETGALASQRSVQALSQGPPPREASTTPAALSGTIDGENAANHTHSSESTLSSVYMRVPAPLSPSRVGNESQAPAAGVWSKDASSTSHSLLTGKAEDNPGSRPRVSHCLSDSEEEEEIEVRQGADRLDDHARASYENDEDDELELEEIGREAQAAIDVAERQSRINQVAEAELNHVYGYDGSEDDDLCRRATIDPNMPPPHRDGSPPKPLRPTAILPRTNEKMVVDEAKGLEVNLPTATAQASCTVLSPNIIDPFAELGTSGPIHRESVGDGRTDPKRSSTAYAEHSPIARSRSVETEVTVASSSSQSKLPSSGEHGNLKPLVPGATRRFGETLRFNPFHMDYKRPEEAAPSLDAISNDDDSPDNNRVSSLIQRHQRTPPWEGPGSKRALRSELSNINSPTGPPTTRQASRSQASASGDGEVQAQYLPARGAGKRRASIGSANIPESDDKVLSDSEGSDYLLGRSQGTKHHSKPVTLAVKTNGQVAATQTKVHGLGAPSVVVVDGDNEDEGPAVGPSDGPEREASLEPPRPKRRAAKTYTHDRVGRNKRRKTTQDVAGQRKIDGYLPRNETAILSDRPRSSRFHDHTAGVERRGISAEDPYVVEDDE